jgi:NAD(P)-dependent dehydrogenase (short-subunit alcohol dehydrogenase family)
MINQKTALVTGAARGIGNAIALQLAKEGYAIAIMDIINEEDVKENISNIEANSNNVMYIKGDITSSADRNRVFDMIMDKYGRLDVLVNNAGVAPKVRMDILETTEESLDFVLGINLKGTFFLTQKAANIMIELKEKNQQMNPKIINLSSVSAYASSTRRPEYCISKAGISMVTTLYADRMAEYGINVYEIRPGIIYTDMTSVVKDKYDKLIAEGITPIKRWGYPQDIANAVSVLCSDKLNFSTGEVINVDGGFHIKKL